MSESSPLVLTWLGHSAVRVDLPDGRVAVVDPWLDGNPSAPKGYEFDRLDLILVTHGHFDHATGVIPLAKKHGALVIGTFDLCTWFGNQGVERTSGMNMGGTQEVDGLRITQVRADHTSGWHDESGRPVYGGAATGFVVRLADGFTFYHAGDTALFSDMALIGELWRPTLACLPIGDHFTMDPEQAARATKLIGARTVLPIHWGTFPLLTGTPAALREALSRHAVDAEVLELAPGQSWKRPS